jgi:molybdate transport system substrate-binding protein
MRLSRPLRNWSVLLVLIFMLAACSAPTAPSPTAAPVAPTVLATTEAPTAPTVTAASKPAQEELMVFTAASLTESYGAMGKQFEAAHPGVKVVTNFAGSQQLHAQLEQGAQADVSASANTKEMNATIQSSLVVSGTQKTCARNRLVVIFPKDNPGEIATLADLARPGLKLVVADKAVPVGRSTLNMLGKKSQDPTYGADFADKVQKNVVSRENDVKAVLGKVRLGEADAGVVYATDVTPPRHRM